MVTSTLAWKEFREHRAIWLTMAVLSFGLVYGMAEVFGVDGGFLGLDRAAGLVLMALALNGTYGLVCGATLLAGERENGTEAFLDALAPTRFSLWRGKVGAGLQLVVGQAVVAAGLACYLRLPFGWIDGNDPWLLLHWFWLMPAIALEAFFWGLCFSAWCESGLRAAAVAALPLAILWCMSGPLGLQMVVWPFALHVPAALLALGLSAWSYCRPDLQRRQAIPLVATGLVHQARTRGVMHLVWLCWRQGRGLLAGMLAAALILNFFVSAAGLIFWPIVAVLLGVGCGMASFGHEQAAGSSKYLADARLPAGRVWLVKVLFWLGSAYLISFIALFGLFGVIAVLPRLVFGRRPDVPRESLAMFDAHLLFGEGSFALLLLWTLLGFAVGHLLALFLRKPAVGIVLAIVLALMVATPWLPSALLGGLSVWQVVLPPALLLAAGRLAYWDWACGRLWTRAPVLRCAGAALAAVLCLAGGLAYRVEEVPDVGEPFDVAAFVATLPTPEKNETPNRIRDALQTAEAVSRREADRVGPLRPFHRPEPGQAMPTPQAPSGMSRLAPARSGEIAPVMGGGGGSGAAQRMPHEIQFDWLGAVLTNGWKVGPPSQFAQWLDRVFADPWAQDLVAAVQAPPGVFHNPAILTADSPANVPASFTTTNLLEGRALQLLERGDDRGALELLAAELALARQMLHKAAIRHRTPAEIVEQRALRTLRHWMTQSSRSPDLLRRAANELRRHERERPAEREALRAEHLLLRNSLDSLVTGAFFRGEERLVGGLDFRRDLLRMAVVVPWEKERRRRLLNVLASGYFREVDDPYQPPPPGERGRQEILARAGLTLLPGWRPAEAGPARSLSEQDLFQMLRAAHLDQLLLHREGAPFLDRMRGACKRRVALVQLAIARHEAERGRPPAQLADLVPVYLDELPLDPFSGRPFGYRVVSPEPWRAVGRALLERLPLPLRLARGGEEIDFWPGDSTRTVRIAPGQALLWSTGPDATDDGGLRAGEEQRLGEVLSWFDQHLDWLFPVPRPGA